MANLALQPKPLSGLIYFDESGDRSRTLIFPDRR